MDTVTGSLVDATLRAVLLGHDLDVAGWQSVAERLRTYPIGALHPDADQTRETEALRALCELVIPGTTRGAPEHRATDGLPGPLPHLIDALAASSRAASGDASATLAQAQAMYALVPFLPDGRRDAMERIIAVAQKGIGASARVDPASVAFFVLLANVLAQAFAVTEHLGAAFALRQHLSGHEPSMPVLVATSNLVTTAKLLAEVHAETPEPWWREANSLALSICDDEHAVARWTPHARVAREVIWQAAISALTTRLLLCKHQDAAGQIALVQRDFERVRHLAHELDDPDKTARLEALEVEVRELTGGNVAEQSAATVRSVAGSLDALVEQVVATTQRARALAAESEREQAIAQQTRELYGSLQGLLGKMVETLGMNHHVSRIFLALGAMASGRLADTAHEAVRACLLYSPPTQQRSGFYGSRQEGCASFELESACFGTMRALAVLHDLLASEGALYRAFIGLLRSENRDLLASAARFLHVMRPDESFVLQVEDVARIATFTGARPAQDPMTAVARAGEDAACSQAGAPADAIADAAAVISARQRAESSAELPARKWIPDPGSNRSRPEDLVGTTGRLDGVPHRIDSILGRGREKIVLGLVNLVTGKQFALAFFHEDERRALHGYLEGLVSGEVPYDPTEVIARCDAVLNSYPGDEVAAFNKAMALDGEGNVAGAQRWFEVACAANPSDVQNLLFNAHALVRLGARRRAVALAAQSKNQNRTAFHAFYQRFDAHRALMAKTIGEVLREEPDNADALALAQSGDEPA